MRQIDMRTEAITSWYLWLLLPTSVVLVPLVAAADASVEWRVPAECASVPELAPNLAERGQYPSSSATVVITRISSAELEARIAVRASGSVREQVLRDASCLALAQAAALVVTLALHPADPARTRPRQPSPRGRAVVRPETSAADGGTPLIAARTDEDPLSASESESEPLDMDMARTGEKREAAPESQPQRETPPAQPQLSARIEPISQAAVQDDRPEPDARARIAAEPGRLGVYTGVAAGLSAGIIPKLAPTVALTLALTHGALCAALHIGYAPPQQARLAAPEDAGVQVALAHAGVEAGARLRGLGLEFPLVAGLETGLFVARGERVPERSTQVMDWLAASLSAGVMRNLNDRVRLTLRLEGLLALRRPRFALDLGTPPATVFHRPDLFGARISLGLDVHLW